MSDQQNRPGDPPESVVFHQAGNEIELTTGKRFYAFHGILGLSIDGKLELSGGYDGMVAEDDEEEGDHPQRFTPAERKEIATLMVTRWLAWANPRE